MNYLKLFENYETLSVFYSRLDMRTEDAFSMIDYHDSYRNLYPRYNDNDATWADEDTEYYYPTKEDAYKSVNETLDMLESLPEPIAVYRTITVPTLDDVDTIDLGESWSYHKQSALEFGNHINATVLLSGTIASEYVDWHQTVELHYQFSGSQMGDDENEIRVEYPEQIQNLQMEWIGKRLN